MNYLNGVFNKFTFMEWLNMNIVNEIKETIKSLDGKRNDIKETIRVNETVVCMADGEIFCNIRYTIDINDGEDETWDSEFLELPRLLTDKELLMIGNIEQHNVDLGIHKSVYYDVKTNQNKIKVEKTEPI